MNLQTFLNWSTVNMIDFEELIVFYDIVIKMFQDFDSLRKIVSRS